MSWWICIFLRSTLWRSLCQQPTGQMTFIHSLSIWSATQSAELCMQPSRTFTRGIRPPCWASGRHKCSESKHTQYKRPQEKTVTIRDVSVAIIPSCQQNARTSANCWSESSERDKDVKKPRIIISLKRFREKPLPLSLISHCVLTLKGGPDRLIYNPARADKTMLIRTCSSMWLSYYQEGSLKRRWEVPGFECWVRELQGSFTGSCHTSSLSPPSAQPLSPVPR